MGLPDVKERAAGAKQRAEGGMLRDTWRDTWRDAWHHRCAKNPFTAGARTDLVRHETSMAANEERVAPH